MASGECRISLGVCRKNTTKIFEKMVDKAELLVYNELTKSKT
jgi:hypothetical protein